jgi:type II secretory pathway component PulJ
LLGLRGPRAVRRAERSGEVLGAMMSLRMPLQMPPQMPIPLSRGWSTLEVLVGLALGFLILTPLAQLASSQWAGQRQLAADLKLQQSLRTVSDAVARDLRRAGSWGAAESARPGLNNPYAILELTDGSGGSGLADMVRYAYAHPKRAEDSQLSDDEQMGWRLRNGVIESQLGLGTWQALSDPQRVRITRFKLSLQTQRMPLPCALACATPAAPDSPCPAVQMMRTVWIELAGQLNAANVSSAINDPGVQRSLKTAVQLRNDSWSGSCRD